MSIFGSIMSAIFGAHPAEAASTETTPQISSETTPQISSGAESDAPQVSAPQAGQPAPSSMDVATVLTAKAAQASQTLDWQHSITDLMKLLDLDSSLTARKELAAELHYSGDMNDSASMNMWLHSEVMRKLSENGGKVPADLLR